MSWQWRLRWRVPACAPVSVVVEGPGDLELVLNAISEDAMAAGAALQVDMLRCLVPTDNPMLVQFVIGPDDWSSLLWHAEEGTFAAIQRGGGISDAPLVCSGVAGDEIIEGELVGLRRDSVRELLVSILMVEGRPLGVRWREAPMD